MPRFYITPNETDISLTKINEVLSNNISSSVSSTVQPNSKISERSDMFYKYLFSQNITSLTKRPIKFSDFRNNHFFASTVTIQSSTITILGATIFVPASIRIVPIGGIGPSFKIKVYYKVPETYVSHYETYYSEYCHSHWLFSECHGSYPSRAVYATRINDVVVADTVCLRGGNLTITGDNVLLGNSHYVKIEQLDDASNVINSYNYVINVKTGYNLPSQTYTEYFSR